MSASPPDSDQRRADSPNGSPAGAAFPPKTSPPSTSRQNQVTPLAPLQFLQNQRRGSITDPSLHAAGQAGSPFRRPESPQTTFPPSASHEHRRSFSQSRPLSPFKFGDASAQPAATESPNAHFKRLLRSPSAEPGDKRAMAVDRSPREGGPAGPGERHGSEGESPATRPPRAAASVLRKGVVGSFDRQRRTGQRAATTWMSTRTSMAGTRGRTMLPARWKTWTTAAGGGLWWQVVNGLSCARFWTLTHPRSARAASRHEAQDVDRQGRVRP